jgi:hypothetical protein
VEGRALALSANAIRGNDAKVTNNGRDRMIYGYIWIDGLTYSLFSVCLYQWIIDDSTPSSLYETKKTKNQRREEEKLVIVYDRYLL